MLRHLLYIELGFCVGRGMVQGQYVSIRYVPVHYVPVQYIPVRYIPALRFIPEVWDHIQG
jgi:hypothetical protein